MKFAAIVTVIGLATTAVAQSACDAVAAKVPSCAVCSSSLPLSTQNTKQHRSLTTLEQTPCINSAAASVGCGPKDYACQCNPASASAIQASAQSCVLKGCGNEALGVIALASAVCECAATAKGAALAAGPTITSTAAAAATAATLVESTSYGSAVMPSSSSSSSSAVGSASLHTVGTSSSYAAASATVMGSASGPVGTGGMMPINSIVPFTGGAAAVVGSVVGVMGAMLFVIAAL